MFNHHPYKALTTLTLAVALLSPVIGDILPATAQPAQSQVLSPDQKNAIIQRSEAVINLLEQGKYAEIINSLSPSVKTYVTTDLVKTIWENDLIANNGEFKKIVGSKVIDAINADIVTLTVQFAKRTEAIQFVFDKNQALIGINTPSTLSLDEISEKFFNDLARGNYGEARGYLHPLLKTEIFVPQIQSRWQQQLTLNGAFKKVSDVKVKTGSTLNEPDVAIVTVQFANKTADYFIFFDNDRKIVNIDFVAD